MKTGLGSMSNKIMSLRAFQYLSRSYEYNFLIVAKEAQALLAMTIYC